MKQSKQILCVAMALVLVACHTTLKTSNLTKDEEQKLEAASFNTELGITYLKKGNILRAKQKLLAALRQAPNSPQVNSAMAYLMEVTDEPKSAEHYHKKAVSLPTSGGAQYNNYGAFLCRKGQYQNADKLFLKAINDVTYANTPKAYENAGVCAKQASEIDKARRYFQVALKKEPYSKLSLYELVTLEETQGQLKKAFEKLEQYKYLVYEDVTLLKEAVLIAKKLGYIESVQQYQLHLKQFNSANNDSGVKKHDNNHRTG